MTLSNQILDTRFRSALGRMADQGRLQTYSAPVDPYLEVAGIMKKLDGGPALLFSKVNGHDMPVIGNLCRARPMSKQPSASTSAACANSSAGRSAIRNRRC